MEHQLTIREAAAASRHPGRQFATGDALNEGQVWTLVNALLDVEQWRRWVAD